MRHARRATSVEDSERVSERPQKPSARSKAAATTVMPATFGWKEPAVSIHPVVERLDPGRGRPESVPSAERRGGEQLLLPERNAASRNI